MAGCALVNSLQHHGRAMRPCQDPRRARSALHHGALRAVRVRTKGHNRAWRPAAPPTVKRGPCAWPQGVHSPAGRPAPGPRARQPPSPRGAPGPARPAAARLPPPPQRAPRRALGAPGRRVALSKQSMACYGETSLPPAELHHPMPHAATRRVCTAIPLTVSRILALQNQARALEQSAVHAQQAARLLGELCALMRQRRGKALLGCRLHLIERLGACEQHLGTLPRVSSACAYE
jgi:hypothetical protein